MPNFPNGCRRSRTPWPRLAAMCLALGGAAFHAPMTHAEPLRVDNPAAEKNVYPEIEEAKKQLARQDIEGALASFNAAAKAQCRLPNGRVQLAMVYFGIDRRAREGSSSKRPSRITRMIPRHTSSWPSSRCAKGAGPRQAC